MFFNYKRRDGKKRANSCFQASGHLNGVGAACWGKARRLSRPAALYKRPSSLADFPIPIQHSFFLSFSSLLQLLQSFTPLSQPTIANHPVLSLHEAVRWRLPSYQLLPLYSCILVLLAYPVRRKA